MEESKALEMLIKYMQETGKSQAKLAKEMKVGAATISEFLNGKYQGNVEAVEELVMRYLQKREDNVQCISFCAQTSVTRKIFYVLDGVAKAVASTRDAKMDNTDFAVKSAAKLGVFIGRPGIGKTWTLNEYVRKNRNTAVMITVKVLDTEGDVLRKLAKEVGVGTEGRLPKIMEEIITKLEGTETIIIVDEAEHLRPKTIDILRTICDEIGIGLVLCGTKKLEDKINKDTTSNEYEYIYSRIVRIGKANLIEEEDVSMIVETYMKKDGNYTNEEIKKCSAAYTNLVEGSARKLTNLMMNAHSKTNNPTVIKEFGGKVSPALIETANLELL